MFTPGGALASILIGQQHFLVVQNFPMIVLVNPAQLSRLKIARYIPECGFARLGQVAADGVQATLSSYTAQPGERPVRVCLRGQQVGHLIHEYHVKNRAER